MIDLHLSLSYFALVGLAFILTLLHKIIGIELLSDFDTQFEMLTDEILKLSSPCLLFLLLILDIVIVLYYLLDRLPIQLYHLTHVVGLAPGLDLLFPDLLFFVHLTVLEGFPDKPS